MAMTKKIVVLSDTHIPTLAEKLPAKVIQELKNADYIMHAGDFVDYEAYEMLRRYAPVHAVAGNMDESRLSSFLPQKQLITIEGVAFGIIHGWGAPEGIVERLKKEFKEKPNVIIFGHTHKSYCETIGATLWFNPGSPTDTVFTKTRSFGIFEVSAGTIKPTITVL